MRLVISAIPSCRLATGVVQVPARLLRAELLAPIAVSPFQEVTNDLAPSFWRPAPGTSISIPLLANSASTPGRALVNWLWLALANQRLGKPEEARRWPNKARVWLDQF